MKKLILFISVFYTSLAFSQTNEVITVDNADEFVNALGPDRTIQLKGSTIYLSEIPSTKKGDYFYLREAESGFHLYITGVNNLKIIGSGTTPIEIVSKPGSWVLSMEKCNNIHIENISFGHAPNTTTMGGGGISMSESKNISIDKCDFFSSGFSCLNARNVTNLNVKNTILKGSVFTTLFIGDCNNLKFEKCKIIENEFIDGDLIRIQNTIDVKFTECEFLKSSSKINEDTESWVNYLLNAVSSMNIKLLKCIIKHCSFDYLSNNSSSFTMEETTLENNLFRFGKFKE